MIDRFGILAVGRHHRCGCVCVHHLPTSLNVRYGIQMVRRFGILAAWGGTIAVIVSVFTIIPETVPELESDGVSDDVANWGGKASELT